MQSWLHLVKKEFYQTRTWVLIGFALSLLYFIFSYFVVYQWGGKLWGVSAMMLVPIGIHLGYIGIYMLISLVSESKRLHFWLQHPLPAPALFGAKLLNGFLAFCVSYLFCTAVALFGIADVVQQYDITWPFVIKILAIISFVILFFSLYQSVWIISAWTLYQSLKLRIGKLSWLVAVLFLIVSAILLGFFRETELYHLLTGWAYIPTNIEIPSSFIFNPGDLQISEGATVQNLPIGGFLFELVLMVLLFISSCWLLERKVEV